MEEEEMAWNRDLSAPAESSAQGAAAASTSTSTGGAGPKISKNQMKKAAKLASIAYPQAKMEALKPLKRQAERIKRRERKSQLMEGYANGTLSAAEVELVESRKTRERERKAAKRRDMEEDWGGGVVIDLGFDELMADQLSFLYSANRAAKLPFATVLHTSASAESSPRLWPKLLQANSQNWSRSFWWSEGVDVLASRLGPTPTGEGDGAGPSLPSRLTSSHKLVYLSADSEEELDTLREDEVYVIGGIVDRNRYKNKAEALNIRTARLPIGTYLAEMPTRKVLTVNQVFMILSEYVAKQDWRAAFESVIPPRKFIMDYKRQKKAKKDAARAGPADDGEDTDEEAALKGDEVEDVEGEEGMADVLGTSQ